MKLTKHQEQIVDKIVDGKVYDITTYLKEFDKAHKQKYDIEEIRKVFEKLEEDKCYSFTEKDSYYYTLLHDESGKIRNRYRVTESLTYMFNDYPLEEPVKAKLNESVHKQVVQFHGQKYIFDFKEEVLVADSFEDIKEFIALWCYLKNEALIFDVNKPVRDEDIGLFFEIFQQEITGDNNPSWQRTTVIDSVGEYVNYVESHDVLVPYKNINNYIDRVWKLNQDNFNACEEFINRKILSTGALNVYKQKNYQTVEELSVKANLRIAKIAVIISVISVLIGNILPLFHKQDTDYLDEISQKISVIEEIIKENNNSLQITDEIKEIRNDLKGIKEQIVEIENMLPKAEETSESGDEIDTDNANK